MLENSQITLIYEDGMISIINPELIQNKTAEQILQTFFPNDSNNMLLAIRTKTKIEIIQPNLIPLNEFPELQIDRQIYEFSIPDFSLCFLNNDYKDKDIFLIYPSCINNTTISFPPFIYSFTNEDYSKSISQITDEMKEYFGINILDPQICLNQDEIRDCTCLEFIEKFKEKNQTELVNFTFILGQNGERSIEKRQFHANELSSYVQKCAVDLIQFLRQVGENSQKARVFTEFEYNTVFGSVEDMFQAVTRFNRSLADHVSYSDFIANIVAKAIPDIRANFREYFANYHTKNMIADIVARHERDPALEEIINKAFGKKGESFQSMASLPINFIPRVIEIVSFIAEETPNSHPEHGLFEKVIVSLKKLVEYLNSYSMIREVANLQKRMVPLDENRNKPLDSDDRFMVKSYNVSQSIITKSTLYLLSDMAVLTIKKENIESEKFRFKYDEFFFVPNVSTSAIIVKYKGQFSALKFSSSEAFEEMMKNLVERRAEMIKNNPEMNSSLVAIEYVPFKTQSIPSTIGSSSCCKIGNLIMSASYRVLMTLDTRHDKSLNVEKNVKSIHMYGKLVSINNVPYIYGGETYPTPFEFVNGKFVEVKPKPPKSEDDSAIPSFFKDDERLNNVSLISSPKDGRMYHTCCAYKKYIVIYGGYKNERKNHRLFSNDVYFFNVNTAEWFCSNPCHDEHPDPRYKHSAVVYKNLMIIHGGISCLNDELLDDTWCYDFNNGKWTQIDRGFKPIVTPRFGHAATMVGKYMFIIGGLTLSKRNADIHFQVDLTTTTQSIDISSDDNDDDDNIDDDKLSNEEEEEEESNFGVDDNIGNSKSIVGASSCFCMDIEKFKLFGVNVIGNFTPGLSMCAAAYDEDSKKIFLIGGGFLNNREEKNTSVFIQMDVPQFYANGRATHFDVNFEQIDAVRCRLSRRLTFTNMGKASSSPIPKIPSHLDGAMAAYKPKPASPDTRKKYMPKSGP